MTARGGGAACPLLTSLPCSSWEAACPGEAPAEIRAYKLGRSRWSYNQIELKIGEKGGSRRAVVRQAAHAADAPFPEPAQDSAVCFHLQLESGQQLRAHIYIVYDGQPTPRAAAAVPAAPQAAGDAQQQDPSQQQQQQQSEQPQQSGQPQQQGSGGEQYEWQLVLRQHCCKGCQGCLLRSIQRFGRLGKRSWSDAAPDAQASPTANSMKDPRFMYLSLDEACTHVDAVAFRLIVGIYDESGSRLLGTGVSPPVRVLANNDVPTGAARIPLEATLPADWEGWANVPASAVEQDVRLMPAPICPPPHAKRVRATPRKPRAQPAKPAGGSDGAAEKEQPRSAKRRPKAAADAPAGKAAAPAAAGGSGGGGSLVAYSSLGTATESLTEQQGSTPRVVVLSESAWKQQRQQLAGLKGMPTVHLAAAGGARPRPPNRSISLPATAATAQRPQSHWQLQQQRMAAQAGSGAGTPTASGGTGAGQQPGMFTARSLASSGPTASQQPSPTSASPRDASLANDISPFALAAAQASQAMAEGGSSAWPHQGPQQQQQQQQQAPGGNANQPLASPRLDPLVGASGVAPSRSPREQQWVTYSPQGQSSLRMPAPMLPPQLGGSDASSALYYPGLGLPDRAALLQRHVEADGLGPSLAALQAAHMGHALPAPTSASHPGVSPRSAASLHGMVPSAGGSMGPSASASSNGLPGAAQCCPQPPVMGPGSAAGAPPRFSTSPDVQALQGLNMSVRPASSPTTTGGLSPSAGSPAEGEAARQALLLQHAEAQMLAASRAAASRHARMASAFQVQLPEHLHSPQVQQAQHAQQAQHPQQQLYLAHLQAQQQQAQQAQHAAVAAQQAATMAALQRMAAVRMLPFPTAPTPLGPPPSIPGAVGANPKAAGGTASPLPQAQREGSGAPEFDGVRLMMTSPAGFGSLLDVGSIFDDLLP